jgi:hypothetical protein
MYIIFPQWLMALGPDIQILRAFMGLSVKAVAKTER